MSRNTPRTDSLERAIPPAARGDRTITALLKNFRQIEKELVEIILDLGGDPRVGEKESSNA